MTLIGILVGLVAAAILLDRLFRGLTVLIITAEGYLCGRLLPGIVEGPVCGNCRYSVRGLSCPLCPECGVDLQHAGVTEGRHALRQLLARWTLWTFLLLFAAFYAHPLLRSHFAYCHVDAVAKFDFFAPESGAYQWVELEHRFRDTFWGTARPWATTPDWQLQQVVLRTEDGQGAVLKPDAGGAGHTLYHANGHREAVRGPVDAQALHDWLVSEGIDAGHARVQQELAIIAQYLTVAVPLDAHDESLEEESFAGARLSTRGVPVVAPWWNLAVLVSWSAIWLVGLGLIHQRLLLISRPAAAPARATSHADLPEIS